MKPVLEAAPLRKAAEPESPDRKTKIPAWKGPRPHGSLPDISLTTGKPSVSGDAFETRKSSNNQPEAAGRKTDGPPQEFMKWVEKQKLR